MNRDEKGSMAIYQQTNNSEQSQIVCDRVKPLRRVVPYNTIPKVICFRMFGIIFAFLLHLHRLSSLHNPMNVYRLRFCDSSTNRQFLNLYHLLSDSRPHALWLQLSIVTLVEVRCKAKMVPLVINGSNLLCKMCVAIFFFTLFRFGLRVKMFFNSHKSLCVCYAVLCSSLDFIGRALSASKSTKYTH